MDQRKMSFEPKNYNNNQKENKIIIPTPKKPKNLVKPDFSPILVKQNQFGYKKLGSYKKPKYNEPTSPIKSPNYKTSAKIEGRNLFGNKDDNVGEYKFFKKLNFDECINEKNNIFEKKEKNEEKNKLNNFLERYNEEDDDDDEFNLKNNNIENLTPSKDTEEEKKEKKKINFRKCSINIEKNIELLKTGKFEEEFIFLKTLKQDKFSTIYKVQKIKTKEILCIKKIVKTSPKSNIDNLKKITNDFKNNISSKLSNFCVQNIDFWIEKEEFKVQLSELNFCNKNLYLLTKYYENGDIFDFLEKLEENKYIFTENFYWDIVFEMIIGLLFVHECGYIHTDIQPANYLVDINGYLKLNDFSLALKLNEINNLDDIIEGDSRYISKELFHFHKKSKINEKSDIFSLGLSLLELISKIELPYNGELWHKLRDEDFKISDNFFDKCNIKNYREFSILISQMILPVERRPYLKEIINYFPQLKKRYDLLLIGKYQKSCEIPLFNNNKNENNNNLLNLKSAPSTDIL